MLDVICLLNDSDCLISLVVINERLIMVIKVLWLDPINVPQSEQTAQNCMKKIISELLFYLQIIKVTHNVLPLNLIVCYLLNYLLL